MMRALWTAGSGMIAQQGNIDNISNNLANVNTTGFKKARVDFQDLMYQTIRQAGAQSGPDTQVPTGLQMGHGVRQVATQKMFIQGSFQQTDNPLDVAIEGDGFFQITMADGTTAYTRDGSFKKDSQGRVVNSDGYPLFPAIQIPEGSSDLSISADGLVNVKDQTGQQVELGQITIVRFINPAGIHAVGRNLFRTTESSGEPVEVNPGTDGAGTLVQRYLEMSNVQVVEEMINMIVAQRAYETNSKAITTTDEMLGQAANLKR